MQNTGGFWYDNDEIAAGANAVVVMAHGGPVAITVKCAPTGTAAVEFTLDAADDPDADWLPLGTVGAGASGAFMRLEPTRAIRVTAAVAECTFKALQASC